MDRHSPSAERSPALREVPREAPGDPGVALPPLAVGGLVVSTAALVAALRPYLPQLVDVEPLDGGRFLLTLAGADRGTQAAEAKE